MDTVLHDVLFKRCLADREKGLTAGILKTLDDANSQTTLLAVFYYDVAIGGFERFVYNANGVYLPEVAEVLDKLNAGNATKFLDQVLQYCIDNADAYQDFLQGDFSDSDFKLALTTISSTYTESGMSLIDEIPDTLKKLLRQR
ncbi:MAG: hypothetical protein HRU20_22740 [Pseudomonadales bacterium]|nr:hypothetical protein [Pseudomonadales bacterium]